MTDKLFGEEQSSHMGEIKLLGMYHSSETDRLSPPRKNYAIVKDYLTVNNPAFVTLEVPLFNSGSSMWFDTVLKADSRGLDMAELNIELNPQVGEEFFAAVIYCKRTNTPLYFIDKWAATPSEVAKYDLTLDPSPVTDKKKHLYVTPQQDDEMNKTENRNSYMGEALQILRLKHANKNGVHVGGMEHYFEGKNTTNKLQDFLTGKVKVFDSSKGQYV